MPGLPGAAWSSAREGLCASDRASACSRAPEPTRSTFTAESNRVSAAAQTRTRSRSAPTPTSSTGTSSSARRTRRSSAPPAGGRSRVPAPSSCTAPAGQRLPDGARVVEVALVRGKVRRLGAVAQTVGDADRQLGERRQHVELRQRERRHAVDADGVAKRHEVEPAAAALAAGHRAELAAEVAQRALLVGPSISDGNGPSPTRVT